MEPPQLSRQTKRRLIALLAEDRPDGERLLRRLRTLRSLEKIAACSAVIYILAHLCLPEDESERLLVEVLEHRKRLKSRLGRDPGLRVSAIDYLSNVKDLLASPTIVERAELERTERRAFTDSLTDLFNRRYFEGTLDMEIRRSRRYGLALSLLMLDLDSFKPVNDLYGHLLGDLVLKRSGHVIRRSVRESDVACRFGGEEFAVVLPETHRSGAVCVAERIRTRIQGHFSQTAIDGRAVLMTISGGIASYPSDGTDATSLIARADQALYQAKTRGRNRIVSYHSERRRSMRYPFRPTAVVRIAGRPEGPTEQAEPLNLSCGGALIGTREGFHPQSPVELQLAAEGRNWTVSGRVVRIERSPSPDGGHRVAVAFEEPLTEEILVGQIVRGGAVAAARGVGA